MLNKYIGTGYLTRDPELRYTDSDIEVCNTVVACSSGHGNKKRTEYVNIVAYDVVAKIICDFAVEGTLVHFDGPLKTKKWEDRDGNIRYTTQVIINNIEILQDPEWYKEQ